MKIAQVFSEVTSTNRWFINSRFHKEATDIACFSYEVPNENLST